MKIARVTGTVTATAKDSKLSGATFLVTDFQDAAGNVQEEAVVVADACSAGVGDLVLVVTGSAARLPSKVGGMPLDAAAVAVIDHVDIRASAGHKTASNRRKN